MSKILIDEATVKLAESLRDKYSDKIYDGCGRDVAMQFEADVASFLEALADQPAQQEPLTIPDDVVEAAQLMQDGDYRGPLFLARKVFDWVAAHGITKGTK